MLRKIAMALLGAGVLLVMALPAQAKEGEGTEVDGVAVVLTGPGLTSPIVLARGDAVAFDNGIQTFAEMAKTSLRPTIALGPRYQILMTVRCIVQAGYDVASIHEDLYPYATGGPWAFTGAGQSTCMGPVPAGWISAEFGTFASLVADGLPSTPPTAIPAPHRPAPAPSPSSSRPWILVAAVLGLGALVLAGALRTRRNRAVARA